MLDEEYMELCLAEARAAWDEEEVPVGALVADESGAVIARAHNATRLRTDPTAHAEMIVIRKAAEQLRSWRLTGTTLYVTLEPCPMCAGAIVQSRIARLVFGAWDPKAGACGSLFDIPTDRRLNHRADVVGGVLEQESQSLLQDFFRSKRQGTGVGHDRRA